LVRDQCLEEGDEKKQDRPDDRVDEDESKREHSTEGSGKTAPELGHSGLLQ
jgi:hypothetical protein